MKAKVVAYIIGRDEAELLPSSLQNLESQTYPISKKVYVDDASVDGSAEIAEVFGAHVIRLKKRHPSYVGKPELSMIVNRAFTYLEHLDSNYILDAGADILLPENYVQKIVERMEADKKLVVCSGWVKDEPFLRTHPRGAGRIYKTSFWFNHIKRFPFIYGWESYPNYKAWALGYKTRAYKDLVMIATRHTKDKKPQYGHAMRVLGYIPLYAVARSIRTMLTDPKTGIGMLCSYLTSPYKLYDQQIANFLRYYQSKHVIQLFTHPGMLFRRIKS